MQLCCSFPTTSTNPNHVFNTFPYIIILNYYSLGGVGLVGKVGRGVVIVGKLENDMKILWVTLHGRAS